jgi:ESCRT-I complex subunit TSG101
MTLDAERLRAHQADLLSGEPAIRDEMARLEAVRDVCRTVAGRMRGTVEQGERNVAELKRKGDPEVDELVCSTTIVHNQYVVISYNSSLYPYHLISLFENRLINLVAEDNAIEDTIYHLHRALNTGRVDLERFLRVSHTPRRHSLPSLSLFIFSSRKFSDYACASRRTIHEEGIDRKDPVWDADRDV